jgi:porin
LTKTHQAEMTRHPVQTLHAFLHGLTLSLLCAISYWLITNMLAHWFSVSRDDDLLGGMWAVVATVFVYRYSYEESMGAALSRMGATSLSFALCFIYLLFFPFHLWGLATLIGVGAVAMSLLGRPDDGITAGITTAVVMVVAAMSPDHAWKQPILRVVDTIIGAAVGFVGAWISLKSGLPQGAPRPEKRPLRTMRTSTGKFVFLVWAALCLFAIRAHSQAAQEETLSGPDSHETGQGLHAHLLGDWGGKRSRLLERGVRFDFQYISDSLWNIKSEQKERFASWDRFRGTVDIDFGALVGQHGLYFHATALWQGGGNLGAYLGLLTSPSGMSSANTCRLDSWWIEKRWLDERITARIGQFAGQDFYGAQHYAASFIFEPMGYALGNLSTDFESFDPPSTPAFELRVVPIRNLYVKSMVEAEDREPFAHNQTGLVPQFRGVPVSISEIGFTPGKKASSVRAFDNVESRKGYSGLYQFGASYNPGKFTSPTSKTPRSGNYLLYWMASQALWREDPKGAKGLDAAFAYDWSPPDVNRNYKLLTAGVRFNEPLPVHIHSTMSLGYVRSSLSPQFLSPGMPSWKTEHGVEFNMLLDPLPMLLLQPVIQYYANVGGRAQRAVVFGFRTKVEF